MTLSETMRRAGWRECPTDTVRRVWEERGGRWQVGDDVGKPFVVDAIPQPWIPGGKGGIWRPVSTQTWDYDPRGWGGVVGPESKQWDEWWWWQCDGLPTQPVNARRCDDGGFRLVINGIELSLSELGGRFVAPCVKPEVLL